MKISVSDLRIAIKEAIEAVGGRSKKRMPFEDLLELEKRLEQSLVNGKINSRKHANEWADVLKAAGWTAEEYELEQDRRWDYVDMLRAVPEKPFYVN